MRARLLLAMLPLLATACGEGGDASQSQSDAAPQASAAAGDSAAPASSGPAAMPATRPGMWRTVSTSSLMPPATSEDCITAEESQQMAADPAASVKGMSCQDFKVTREGAATVLRARCAAENGTSDLELRVTGDFENRRNMVMIMRGEGQPETRFNMESTRIGAC